LCLVCFTRLSGPQQRSPIKPNPYHSKHLRASTSPLENDLLDLARVSSFSELPSKKTVNLKKIQEIHKSLNIKQSRPKDFYKFIKKIGTGASSKVYECQSKLTSEIFAIKKIKVPSEKVKNQLINEILMTGGSCHPNIVKYEDSFLHNSYLYVVMELMKTNLFEFIKSQRNLSEDLICQILFEILKGLENIHKNYRIHRDIKSDNVLISRTGLIKIADFGFSAQLTLEQDKRNTIVGTPSWMAPELFQAQGYDCKVDVWSLGIIALELANGTAPYLKENPFKIMALVSNSPAPSLECKEKWSDDFNDFIQMCLQKNPESRWSSSQLIKHQVFHGKVSQSFTSVLKEWLEVRENEAQ
jgi:serine/threonine protein kinase